MIKKQITETNGGERTTKVRMLGLTREYLDLFV